MNFETNEPFDSQLGRLIAIIIMCERNIEEVRKKLSGNQQFHTRLVFQRLDYQKKGQITPEDIVYNLSSEHPIVKLTNCQNFCRKYSVSGAITYEELLTLLVPKTDKSLSQRMLIRTTKRGATLPNYLWRNFCSLLISLISMTAVTEQMRRKIQNVTDLNHLEMVQFFRTCLKEQAAVWRFCNMNSAQEYDFAVEDVRFLSNHLRSGNSIRQMTDQDIKELICPLDMNFQKTVHQMANYYQNIKLEKQKTINGAFFEQTKAEQLGRKTNSANFLNSKYQPFFSFEGKAKQNQSYNYPQYPKIPQKPVNNNQSGRPQFPMQFQDDEMILKPTRFGEGSQMYLDNFIKPISYESTRRAIELNGYMKQGLQRFQRSGYQKFDDPLSQNSASEESNSAFIQY